jgi:hypothetical protein
MATTKVSALSALTSPDGAEELLINDGGTSKKITIANLLPDNIVDEANLKVSNSPTNGYVLSAQSGNTGGLTWAAASSGNTTSHGLYEMAHTISANYTITSGNNALTAGPTTVASGVSVTVPSGSTWVIA